MRHELSDPHAHSIPPLDNPYIEGQALSSNGQHCQAFETTAGYATDLYDRSTQWTYPESNINIMDTVLTNKLTNKGSSTYAFDVAYLH